MIDSGVSIWTSNRRMPAGRPSAASSRSRYSANIATCSAATTFGNVIVNPPGSRPSRSRSAVRNPSSVRIARSCPPSANDFTRSPQ